jgi:hypothetical protein
MMTETIKRAPHSAEGSRKAPPQLPAQANGEHIDTYVHSIFLKKGERYEYPQNLPSVFSLEVPPSRNFIILMYTSLA